MALTRKQLVDLLKQKVPVKDTWTNLNKEAYGPYNLHLCKRPNIERALYCVTPTEGVIKQFKDGDYDILLTHHPYVRGVPQFIAHTALDCTEGGLNDYWRDALGVKNAQHFDGNLGWHGEIDPIPFEELVKKCENVAGTPLVGEHHGHGKMIKSVVICTGLGGMVEGSAHKSGADCYILGEATRHHSDSPFGARIELGHTVSESGSGLAFFRRHLEPHGITVDQASLEHDKFSGEVYNKPVHSKYFSEEASDESDKGVVRTWPGWKARSGRATYNREPGKTWGPAWRDVDWNDWEDKGKATQELTGVNDDTPEDPGMDSNTAAESDFWASYWAKAKGGERKEPAVFKKPDMGDLRPVNNDIPGVRRDPETPKKIEKPPMRPGGDFPEGGEE